MAYNDLTDRTDAGALMPEEVSRDILGNVGGNSIVMSMGRRLPNMTRAQQRIPVWNTLPSAYFVAGDTGFKQTTKMAWDNVYLNVEEVAVIVPLPDAVVADADYPLWDLARPAIISAIGAVVDGAILYGIDAPSTWPVNLLQQIENHGHDVTLGEVGDLYDDIFAENGVLDLVERDGYQVNGHLAAPGFRAKLRGLRDLNGVPLFQTSLQNRGEYALDGNTLRFADNGSVDPSRASLISGDWNQLVWAVRQDLTFKVLTEAVLTDNNGTIIYNLAQQDMTALRIVMRLAWALPNPINRQNTNAATRFPFAALEPVSAS